MEVRRVVEGHESIMTPGLQVFSAVEKTGTEQERVVRVAAYCRVSTDMEMQQTSLDLQMESYRRTIAGHPGWVLAGIYADKGTTGTTIKGRTEFNRMMADAEAGRIDYILAKSISRFARNTLDALTCTRKLRDLGVGVYFEEQKLDTSDFQSEMLLTIHSAFAQEESHSISENMKRGMRARFAMGIPKWSQTYGLKKEGDDLWVPDPDTAPVVRRIFDMAAEGNPTSTICRTLMDEGIPGPAEGKNWYPHTVSLILRNEKYIGDVAMQKCYTADHLSHKHILNDDARVTRYYRKNHHEAIVDRETFAVVQKVLDMKINRNGYEQYPLGGTLRCPYCGDPMVGFMLPGRTHKKAWTCGGHGKEGLRSERSSCPEYHVGGAYLIDAIIKAFNGMDDVLLSELGERRTKAGKAALKWKRKGLAECSYLFLHELVDSITFPVSGGTVDWDTLLIRWKLGFESREHISYPSPLDHPCTRDDLELDGEVLSFKGRSAVGTRQTYESLIESLGYVSELRIKDRDDIEVCGVKPLPATPSVTGTCSRRYNAGKTY